MERIIKFKAKRLDNNEWITGDLLQVSEKDVQIYNKDCGGSDHPVDPSTICQFTGLRDKNGKEIWEGDILSNYPFLEGEVSFYKGCLIVLRSDGSYVPLYEYINNEELDVANLTNIGSKFDRKGEK